MHTSPIARSLRNLKSKADETVYMDGQLVINLGMHKT